MQPHNNANNAMNRFDIKYTLLFLILLTGGTLLSQEDVRLRITDYGSSVIRLAVPNFYPRYDNYGASWDSTIVGLSAVLRDDLSFSPFLDVVDSVFYPQKGLKNPKDVEPFAWANIGVQTIIFGCFDTDGKKVGINLTVWSVTGSSKIYKHNYESDAVQARRLVHRMADDIHKILTGEEGVAQTQIAFISTRHGGNKELYVCDYDGFVPRRITNARSIVLSPDWSPSGDRLTYTSYKNGNPDLYMYDIYKEQETVLAKHPEHNLTASWSPDGKYVVYSRVADSNSELFLLDVRTKEESRLTYTPYSIETSPCFSPTGREIVFTSDRSGSPQLYIMDAMGSNVRRLTFEGSYNDGADWSPRGNKICYTSRTKYGFDIAVIDIAAGNPVYLTDVGNNENPYWSPDGYHIVFTSNRSGSYQIYTMNWDGSDVRRITDSGSNTSPAWSPRYRWSFE